MAWSTPKSWTTGYKVLALDLNLFLSDNDTALRAGGLAISSQAANDVLYATSATQLGRLAAGTAGKVLTTQGTGSAPTWETPTTGDITSVVAGAGMTGGGTSGDVTLNVIGTADKITVNANDVTIASTYVGQTSITTLGTVATGTWQGTAVADGYVVDALTISGGTVNNSVIGGSTAAAGTFTQVDVTGEGDLRLQDTSGGQYVGFDAPATVSTSYTLTFPAAIGSVDQLLTINNVDGTLQWATAAATTPGGSDTQVQYNDGGSFGGDAGLVFDDSTNLLTVDGVATEKIVFPDPPVASADAHTLDYYEEGNWTPVIGGSGGTGTGQTYSNQRGVYTRIGNMVHVEGQASFTDKDTITGTGELQGLPFASAGRNSGFVFHRQDSMATAIVSMAGDIAGGGTVGAIAIKTAAAVSYSGSVEANFLDYTNLVFSANYQAS